MNGDLDRVLVAGASGRTGRHVLSILSDRDLVVRGSTRSAEKREALVEEGADEVVVGDLLDPEDASEAVKGCSAVISTVGAGPWGVLSRRLVDGAGVVNLVDAAEDAGVGAFVLTSSIGVGDSRPGAPLPLRLFLYRPLSAKERAERRLRSAGVDHVIVRPGALTDDPASGDPVVAEGGDTVSGRIPREDVAHLLVAALTTPDARDRTFEVVGRDSLNGDPSGVVDLDWQGLPDPSATG